MEKMSTRIDRMYGIRGKGSKQLAEEPVGYEDG
jgi:hypothetical protein